MAGQPIASRAQMGSDAPVGLRPATPVSPAIAAILGPATELARAGQHADALRLLAAASAEDSPVPSVLDLLARIHAQQGRYHEAKTLWVRTTDLEPDNTIYQEALERVRRIQRSPLARLYASPWVASGSKLIAAVSTVTLIGVLAWPGRAPQAADTPAGAAAGTATSSGASAPSIRIAVPGIDQRVEADAVILTPTSGLFSPGSATLTARAKELLTGVGRQLAPLGDTVEIRIVGYTDDSPMMRNRRFRDNNALGMARAVTVYEHLKAAWALQPTRLFVANGGTVASAGAEDIETARSRNRTAVIRVTRMR